jgi:tetratricopeptide (TPR) repeat protein
MTPEASACPDTRALDDLVAGRLAAARFMELEAHVTGCAACGSAIAHIAVSSAASRLRYSTMAEDAPGHARAGAAGFALVDRDRFLIVREIAHGGMGRILEAYDARHGRAVALKTILRADVGGRARFAREARITAGLQHPGIVPLYETGRWSDEEPFLVMKLVSGRPLDRVVAATLTTADRLALVPNVVAMTDALAYAHEKGVVHRDLKPSNVLLGSFGETIVIDWGLARAAGDTCDFDDVDVSADGDPLSASATLTRAGAALGTPGYMPPEQARGERVDARADVYALGALLYHVLAGEPPYGRSAKGVVARVLEGPPDPLASKVPGVPPDLLAIVEKAMSRDPGGRYADARAMAEDLRRFQAGNLVAAQEYSLGALVARWVARHRGRVTMAAILLLTVALTAGVSVRRILRERDRADVARREADDERRVAVMQRDAAEKLVNYMMTELDERLEALGKLDLLAGLGTEVDAYYRTLGPSTEANPDALGRRATALLDLAAVEARRGDGEHAALLIGSAADVTAERCRLDPTNLRAWVELGRARSWRAGLLQARSPAQAEIERGAALVAASAVASRAPIPAWAHAGEARVYAELAEVVVSVPDLDAARALMADARREIVAVGDFHSLDWVWKGRLAETNYELAALAFRLKDWPVALETLAASVAIHRALRDERPDHAGNLDELAQSVRWLGQAYDDQGDPRQALAAFREAVDIQRAMTRRAPDNVMITKELIGTLTSLCELVREWEGAAAAEPTCSEASEVARKLRDEHPHDKDEAYLLARADKAAGLAALAAHHEEARRTLENAVAAARSAVDASPKDAYRRAELADCLKDLGRAELALSHPDTARERLREAIGIMEPRLAAPDAWSLAFAGELWMLVGDAERGDEARAAYTTSLGLYDKARKLDPDDAESALERALVSRKLAASERDTKTRGNLLRGADEAIASSLAAGKVSPEWRVRLQIR